MKVLILIICFALSGCQNKAPEWETVPIALAAACYGAARSPGIQITKDGLLRRGGTNIETSLKLTSEKNGVLWITMYPGLRLNDGSKGRSFSVVADKRKWRFWEESGVKYLEVYTEPKSDLVIFKSHLCV